MSNYLTEKDDSLIQVPIADLGISFPWLVADKSLSDEIIDPEADLFSSPLRNRRSLVRTRQQLL